MKSSKRAFVAAAIVVNSVVSWLAIPGYAEGRPLRVPVEKAGERTASLQSRLNEIYGKLPLSFEANQGQFDSRVKFVSRATGHTIYLTSTEAVLCFYTPIAVAGDRPAVAIGSEFASQQTSAARSPSTVLRMKLIGAAPARIVDGIDELPGKSNYFLGNDPKDWRTGVKNFAKVRYRSVYPGIDLVFHSDQRDLEYDFNVAPGANPAKIRLSFKGAERVTVDKNGGLVLKTTGGEIRQPRPMVYQEIRGTRKQILARFVKRGRDQVGFRVSRYDRRKPLVIDPVLIYSTYLGGSGLDNGQAVAVDNSGSAYITGSTRSTDFPTANAFQAAIGGTQASDVFITKLNPTGTALVYSTYLGGSLADSGSGIALDSSGNAYITGQTSSVNFPTANPFQGTPGGAQDAFVTKLNPQGSMLSYSTYLGGTFNDSARGIAVDSAAAVCVTGSTDSPDFPLVNALRTTIAGTDAFVSKINSAGTALVYSTFLGGKGDDAASAVAVDLSGNAYVTGSTRSSDFPLMNSLQSSHGDKSLFKSTDSGASWTPINNGVSGSESILALAIDPTNSAILYAGTATAGTYKTNDAGGHWAPAGLGLPDADIQLDIAVDPVTSSNVYEATWSTDVFKTTNGGTDWSVSCDGPVNTSIAIDPVSPSTVYVGNAVLGVSVTTDGGATWEVTDFPAASSRVSCVAVDPVHPGSFYAGTELSGIHRYPVGCPNITPIGTRVFGISVSPSSPSTVFLATSAGVYKTTDAGLTWKPTNTGLAELIMRAIAVDPVNPMNVYASTQSLCYKSTDGGDSWSPLIINPQSPTITVSEIVIDPANPSTLYVGSFVGGDAFITKLNPSGTTYLYSSFLGGSGTENGIGITVDSSNAIYIVGSANSLDIPSANSLRPFAGLGDAMIARLTPDGNALSFFSYLGGNQSDAARSVSIDSSGNVWLAGETRSANFPTTPDAIAIGIPCAAGACTQGFVSRFNSLGTSLSYSTYLGGTPSAQGTSTFGRGLAIDASGSAYVVGQTFALDFPTTPGAFQVNNGGGGTSDAFVSKIGSPCAYSLSKTAKAFPPEGGSASFELTSALGCPWTVVTSDSWILLNSADTGTGGATISIEVRENFEERFRIGTLAIGGQTYTVLQEGLASVGCSNAITPTFGAFPSVGGNSNINVIASEECIWEAASNASWIAITSTDTGIGVGVVSYQVSSNPSTAARHGTITIAGKTFNVKQKGNVGNGRGGLTGIGVH